MANWLKIGGGVAIALLAAGNFSEGAGYSGVPSPVLHQDRRYQSAHFVLTAPSGPEPGEMLEELERAYRGVQSYGLRLPGRIMAHLYGSAGEFVRGSGGSSYNLALASGEELFMQPLRILRRHGDPARVLTHELTHIALEGGARRGLPRWFNEGITMTLAGERQPETFRFRRLDQLADSLAHSRSYRVVRSAYGASERLVRGLAAEYGRERLLQICRDVAAGRNFDAEFQRLAGRDPRAWAARRLGDRKG